MLVAGQGPEPLVRAAPAGTGMAIRLQGYTLGKDVPCGLGLRAQGLGCRGFRVLGLRIRV